MLHIMNLGGGRSCIRISGGHGWSVVGSSDSKLGPSGREKSPSGKDLGEVEVSK